MDCDGSQLVSMRFELNFGGFDLGVVLNGIDDDYVYIR